MSEDKVLNSLEEIMKGIKQSFEEGNIDKTNKLISAYRDFGGNEEQIENIETVIKPKNEEIPIINLDSLIKVFVIASLENNSPLEKRSRGYLRKYKDNIDNNIDNKPFLAHILKDKEFIKALKKCKSNINDYINSPKTRKNNSSKKVLKEEQIVKSYVMM